jgi:mannonate dehydratase
MQKKPIPRRRLLVAGLAAGAGAAAWRWWPEQGFINPCRAALPPALANHEIVQAAWQGIDASNVWDCHAHLVGTGDSGSGAWINPQMESPLHPLQFLQRLFYLNAGCTQDTPGRVDQSYVERMHNLLDGMRPGVKLLLLAFDFSYRADASLWADATSFHTPNEYAARIARAHPQYFEWAASVHPYRHDCVTALERAARDGARAVKWLPAAMNIDPASPLCDRFYEALKRLNLPLITHGGMERAVNVGSQDLGNPLKLRRALDHGVRVVVAHCASIGEDRDLDRGPNGPLMQSFALFTRLMDEARYEGRLFGELSAMTQLNRAGATLAAVIERAEWHHRLLNGSDYPLPGIMPLYSVDYMVDLKFIKPALAPVLSAIRRHNPLLFDFVLKRNLEVNGRRLAASVFETRAFFAHRDS